ncbi:MAG: Asp-tRNA(Asn)/Glu-tRNA(Gln) amidotransferase subunit GatB [Chlamydia sp.]
MSHNNTSSSMSIWEPIIGLEIHAQLNTVSKLFSSGANQFGEAPNENICELSTGLPGSLPVLNKKAVEKAVLFGLAISGNVQNMSRFDRKSYFYPDCPRNYQITQFYHPIILGGEVHALVDGEEKVFGIERVQLEDDAGMLKHFSSFAGIDFNRSGVPLIEIVSQPCMRSSNDAVAYATAIRSILDYLDISDCNMEEGSIRFDVNVSVRKRGEKGFRNRIEIKNMNSFAGLKLAIDYEIERQSKLYEANPDIPYGELIPQSTYRWDPEALKTVLMRSKEQASDYRYSPDPDLLTLILDPKEIEEIGKKVPELPLAKERRYRESLGLSSLQSYFLTNDKKMATYFEEALRSSSHPKPLANWISVEFTGRLKDSGKTVYESKIAPCNIAELVELIASQKCNGKIAKIIADKMVENPQLSPKEIIEANPDFISIADSKLLKTIAQSVIEKNESIVLEYISGRDRVFAFLVGQVMKETKGSASPELANIALLEAISEYKKSKST